MDQQIAFAVGVQEAVGLDVLVHGEPERTDMVEYFGVQLGGLAFTLQVTSCRCTHHMVLVHGYGTAGLVRGAVCVSGSITGLMIKG